MIKLFKQSSVLYKTINFKIMKKVFLVALMVVGLTTFAQERGEKREKLTADQRTDMQVKKMSKDLSLNDSQQKDIKTLFFEQAKKRESKMEEIKANRENGEKLSKEQRLEMKTKMQEQQKEMQSKLKSILNEDQMRKWEALKAERKEKMRSRMEQKKAK